MKRIACLICAAVLVAGCSSTEQSLQSGIGEFQVGNLDKAKDHFQQVLGRYPRDPVAHYYLARIYHAEGAYEKAIFHYQCSIDADPSNGQPKKWLVRAQEEAPQVGTALKFLPDDPKVAMPGS
jgi:tetratricopeptide (TPR) repeat protein